jgi:hypothetical protein
MNSHAASPPIMLNQAGSRCLLFGASGRLGKLCSELMSARRMPCGSLLRNGDLVYGGSRIGNIHEVEPPPGRYAVIDASIDHGSLAAMSAHEDAKSTFLERLNSRGGLAGLLAFSSGVAEFDDALIKTEWHRCYKRAKLRLEGFASRLSCPAYCPRLFVVIGPRSFEAAATGWVDVVRQACESARVGMGMPDEPRSWVAESFLERQINAFLDAPGEARPATPLNGTFSLGLIARFAAQQLGREIAIERRDVAGWLSVPYVSRVAPLIAPEYSLDAVLSPLVAKYAAGLRG